MMMLKDGDEEERKFVILPDGACLAYPIETGSVEREEGGGRREEGRGCMSERKREIEEERSSLQCMR